MSGKSRKAGCDYHEDKNRSRKVRQLLSDVWCDPKVRKAANSKCQLGAKKRHTYQHIQSKSEHISISSAHISSFTQSFRESTDAKRNSVEVNCNEQTFLPVCCGCTTVRLSDWLPCEWSVERLDCRLIHSVSAS